jgi:A/G-specific adenine glycosylase
MELGALICTPKQPKCLACPVRSNCVAYRTGRTDEFPAFAPRTAPTARFFAAFIVQNRQRYLVQQRPSGVVNAHLWEFPNAEFPTAPGASDLNHAAETLFGQAPQSTRPLCTVKHTITRYRITLTAFHATLPNAAPRAETKSRWCTLVEMQKLPFPSAHQKILRHLTQITVPT